MRYDLAIIGSGAAAFSAAIAARGRGRSVVMIERGTIGGTCVNDGCVPSKALLAAAEARHVALDQHFPGIATSAGKVDASQLRAGKAELVDEMRTAKYIDRVADHGWTIINGTATFTGSRDNPVLDVMPMGPDGGGWDEPGLEVNPADPVAGGVRRVEADHYLVATGSAPSVPDVDGLAEAGYLTSETAMELDRLPESMIVIGGGAVGLEQGQLFARLGVKVTIIEALDRLAPYEDPVVSAVIEGILADEGITVATSTAIDEVRRKSPTQVVVRSGSVEFRRETVLVAVGRRPITDVLGLDRVGVKTLAGGGVVVDEYLRTSNPRIWAAGDVTGGPQLVYVAAAQGKLVAGNVFGADARILDYTSLPRVTFTSPAIASVGLTDQEAVEQGYDCECRVLPLEHVPRAVVNRDVRGVIKLVAEAGTGRLLGAHIVADAAGDVIATAVQAIDAGMTVEQIAGQWFPYLTMAEGLKLAAQSFTRDITKLSCCAA